MVADRILGAKERRIGLVSPVFCVNETIGRRLPRFDRAQRFEAHILQHVLNRSNLSVSV
jgi:hypothetical protein